MTSNSNGLIFHGEVKLSKNQAIEDIENWPLWRIYWYYFRLASREHFPKHFIFDPGLRDNVTSTPRQKTIVLLDGTPKLDHPDLEGRASFLFEPVPHTVPALENHATAMASIAVAPEFGLARGSRIFCAPVLSEDKASFLKNMKRLSETLPELIKSLNNEVVIVGTFNSEPSKNVDLLAEFLLTLNVPVVWSAGNHGERMENYSPGKVTDLITVGASSMVDSILCEDNLKSNYSEHLTVMAPGKNIMSAWATLRDRIFTTGTSPASMIVASILAKVNRPLNHVQAKEFLIESASEGLMKNPSDMSAPNRLAFDPHMVISEDILNSRDFFPAEV